MNVNVKEQLRVERDHVENVVEDGGEEGDAHVDDGKEDDHLNGAPKRLEQLPDQHNDGHVDEHLPEVHLEEAVREGRPDPKVGRPKVARGHADGSNEVRVEGESVKEDEGQGDELDGERRGRQRREDLPHEHVPRAEAAVGGGGRRGRHGVRQTGHGDGLQDHWHSQQTTTRKV